MEENKKATENDKFDIEISKAVCQCGFGSVRIERMNFGAIRITLDFPTQHFQSPDDIANIVAERVKYLLNGMNEIKEPEV